MTNQNDCENITNARGTGQGGNMKASDDMNIAKKMGIDVLTLHDILTRFERLDARELNLLAMQLINRSVMQLEKKQL